MYGISTGGRGGNRVLPAAPTASIENILSGQILPLLAPSLRSIISKMPSQLLQSLEEIRLRLGRPLQVYTQGGDTYVDAQGRPVRTEDASHRVNREELIQTMQLMTRSSLYALEEELRRGYITVAGGHRVGLAGRTVLSPEGSIQTMKDIVYLNIRIARQIPGVANSIKQYIVNPANYSLYNTLVISPPQCGKTTLLRDLARQISDGSFHSKMKGLKVGIVDERSELAGCVDGVPQHAVGARTDVMDACPKADGMLMMIRSMSPHVLITDEIGREQDRDAILEAVHAGVQVLTSAHGYRLEDVRKRPALSALFEGKVFNRYLVLSRQNGPITLEAVYDGEGHSIYRRKG
jgi:stage III sporulation protein AA